MGHRLSKIYTRTGDNGTTGLGDGSRVEKDHIRVEAYGNVDELNSLIGMLLAQDFPEGSDNTIKQLTQAQHRLFDLGGELSIPGHTMITADHTTELESFLDELNQSLEPLKEFILPGGTQAASLCHLARCVCRRTERCTVTLARTEQVNPHSISYLNRLSDLLFVLARHLNKTAGVEDVLWNHQKKK